MTTENNADILELICDGISVDGFAVVDQAFSFGTMKDLHNQLQTIEKPNFKTAGVGRSQDFQINKQVRSDQIMWLNQQQVEYKKYFEWVEKLRLALNKRFYLGLFEYECMFAHYPKGAFYHKHVDAFKASTAVKKSEGNNRIISTLLYFNPDWKAEDGGELLMYHHDQQKPFKKILPELGRMVVFLSEEFPHEVLPANKSRYSLTGWFRCQA